MTQRHEIPRESLDVRGKRWRKALADAATGPLIIAAEVCSLAEEWEQYKKEAGGLTCSAWVKLKVAPGGLRYFKERATAIERLGEAIRRTLHHDVAVWVSSTVAKEHHEKCKFSLMRAAKAEGRPLTMAQAKRLVAPIIGKAVRKKTCRRCKTLEKALRDAGVEVPD